MKCLILAAGYATRLYPLTRNFPKPLLKVGGKPIVDWLIDDLRDIADGFVVVTNHKYAAIFSEWAQGRGRPIVILDDGTTENERRLGAVRDIEMAVKSLGIDEDTLVMAGDNMLDFSLKGFVRFAEACGCSCVMCHEEPRLEALQKTAVITVAQSGVITSYEEKPRMPRSQLAVPPFYYYTAGDLNRVGEALQDGCGFDAPGSFAAWLSGKSTMYAYRMPGRRYDIGDMRSYEDVCSKFDRS